MRKTWICKTVNDTPFGSVVKFASNSKEYYIYMAHNALYLKFNMTDIDYSTSPMPTIG